MPKTQKLPIDTKASASEMADAMFGTGIEIVSASYSGAGSASGIYSDGDSIAPHLTPSDTGVILSTGKATAVTSGMGDSNQSSGTSTNHGRSGDKDLEDIAGTKTFDAAVIEAEFVPQGSELTMQITFSSEEYLEYAGSGFNDAVGVFVNGEKAELTIGDGDITINNINDVSNQNLYVDNPAHAEVAETEMDGFTVTLTLKAPVNPGEVNSIKIAIADGGDGAYDSNLMIAGNSVQTALIARDDELTLTENSALTLNVLTNDSTANGGTLSLTHINGQAVEAGDSVELATGETITLNPDGTFSVVAAETPGSSAFSYRVADGSGNSDTAFVTLHTEPDVACFVAGTLIQTATGHQPVELLTPGTMVWTRDSGLKPLRWVGRTRVVSSGKCAPIVFRAGAIGPHQLVALSPNHRVLVTSTRAEVLFGEPEVLVKAKDLVNDHSIRQDMRGGLVTYVHLLFDDHEIICGGGMLSESYHPGLSSFGAFDRETQDKALRLMPDLQQKCASGYGPTTRPVLRSFEANALLSNSLDPGGGEPRRISG